MKFKAKKLKIKNLSRIKWKKLTSKQKTNRILSLKVLSMIRHNKSLTWSSNEIDINPKIVKSHIKSAIIKKRKRWKAKKYDKIERVLVINEKGYPISIIVKDSKYASLIGKYHTAVKKFLKTGNIRHMRGFKSKIIIDSKGKKHRLETDPDILFEIADAREDEEFYDIYSDRYE